MKQVCEDTRKITTCVNDNQTGEKVYETEEEFKRIRERHCLNGELTYMEKFKHKFQNTTNAIKGFANPRLQLALAMEYQEDKKCMHSACRYPDRDRGKEYKMIKLEKGGHYKQPNARNDGYQNVRVMGCRKHSGWLHLGCFFKCADINNFGVCQPDEGWWSYFINTVTSGGCERVNRYDELTRTNKFLVHWYDADKMKYFVSTVFIIASYVFNMWAHYGSGWYTSKHYNNLKPVTEYNWVVTVDTIASIFSVLSLGHMFIKGMIVNFMNIISEKVMNKAGWVAVLITLLQCIPHGGSVVTTIQIIIGLLFGAYAWNKGVTFNNIAVQIMYFAWVITAFLMMWVSSFGILLLKDPQGSGESADVISKLV